MKIDYKLKNLNIQFETDTVKDIVAQLYLLQEVFGETQCGKCGSENLRFVVREKDGNEYYELRCIDCGARLSFGVHKKGGSLFPKRKDSDGNWLPDKGWQKWNSKTNQLE